MTAEILFQVPTRLPRFELVRHLGRAVELATLGGVYIPYDLQGDESWVIAGDLLRGSRHLHVVAEFHPAASTPVYAAKVAATLHRFTARRLGWSLLTETDEETALAQGDPVAPDQRLARADEFLTVARGVWSHTTYDFAGAFYDVHEGGLRGPHQGLPFPRVYLSGTTAAALDLSARHADVHLLDATDEPDVAAVVAELAARAAAAGRASPLLGLRLGLVAREDPTELADVDIPPGALAGSYAQVADTLAGHVADGVSAFVVDTAPDVAEAYRIGEHLIPLLTATEDAHVA